MGGRTLDLRRGLWYNTAMEVCDVVIAATRPALRRGARLGLLLLAAVLACSATVRAQSPARPRLRRRTLRHRHLVRGARVRRARRRLLRRPPVDPARAARGRGSLPSLDEAPRTRLGDHRRNLPVPKLVAGQGPRAAEARSPLGRRRQGKAGRPGLRDLLDQAARTWSRVLHRSEEHTSELQSLSYL